VKLNFSYFSNLKFKIILIVFLINGFLYSQNIIINEIQISGNKITKDKVIFREIYQEENTFFDSSIVSNDVTRLLNLGLFTDIEFDIENQGDQVVLKYNIIESSLRFIPGFAPFYTEDTGWSYAIFSEIMNFRGLNQSVNAGLILGGMNSFGMSFEDPWLFGDHISFGVDIYKNEWDHNFLPYYLNQEYSSLKLGKWWDYKIKLDFEFGIDKKKYISEDSDYLTDEFKILSYVTTLSYDKRDIYRNPSNGFLISSFIDYNRIYNKNSNRTRIIQSFSKYLNSNNFLKKFTFGLNTTFSILLGNDEEKMISYFGGSNTIRGWNMPTFSDYLHPSNSHRFGNHHLILSAELRTDLIKYSPLKILDLNFEKGLTALIFYDIGLNSKELKYLISSNNLPLIGFGFGFKIPFWGSVIGPDFGWSYYNKNYISFAIHIRAGHKF